MCANRLRPEPVQAKGWLERLIGILLNSGRAARSAWTTSAAAILVAVGVEPNVDRYRWARGGLLRLGVDFAKEPPKVDGVRGYQLVLLPQTTFKELWARFSDGAHFCRTSGVVPAGARERYPVRRLPRSGDTGA